MSDERENHSLKTKALFGATASEVLAYGKIDPLPFRHSLGFSLESSRVTCSECGGAPEPIVRRIREIPGAIDCFSVGSCHRCKLTVIMHCHINQRGFSIRLDDGSWRLCGRSTWLGKIYGKFVRFKLWVSRKFGK